MAAKWCVFVMLAGCGTRGPSVLTAEEIGTIEQSPWITGRDGGCSSVAFDTSVWVYGDTVLAEADAEGGNWHTNSYSYTTDFDASDGLTGFTEPPDAAGAPREFMPETAYELAFNDAHAGDDCAQAPCGARWANWAGNPHWDAERQRGLVLYGILYVGDGSEAGGGHSVASWEDIDRQPVRPVVDSSSDFPDILWTPDEGDWGSASLIDGEFFYAYACDLQGLERPCRVGRAPLDRVAEKDAWVYWDGEAWQDDSEAAAKLFSGSSIMSIAWNEHLGAWLNIYSPPFDGAIRARTAPELTGPWSNESVLYDLSDAGFGDEAPYDANQHAEMAEDGGRVIYITWSRHTTGWFGSEFPLLRVEFP